MTPIAGPPVPTLLNRVQLGRPLGRRWATAAVVFAIALYLTRWGSSTIRAFEYLRHPSPQSAPTVSSLAEGLISTIALIVVAWIALLVIASGTGTPKETIGLGRPESGGWRAMAAAVAVGLISLFAVRMGFVAGDLINLVDPWVVADSVDPHPDAASPLAGVLNTIYSGLSGASEEFVVLGLLVVALRSAKCPWPVVYLVAVALRVVFHVYYGPGFALGMAVWAVVVLTLYHLTGRIWPLFVTHFLHNSLTTGFAELAAHDPARRGLWHEVSQALPELFLGLGSIGLLMLLFSLIRVSGGKSDPSAPPGPVSCSSDAMSPEIVPTSDGKPEPVIP